MIRLCLWLAVAVALVPPAARLPTAVVRDGASADYFTQRFGCTAEEAAKAERKLLPSIARRMTRAQADELCSWLQSTLGLSESELKKLLLRRPPLLGYSLETSALKLEWLASRLALSDAELKKFVVRQPAVLSYNVETTLEPDFAWLQSRLDLSMAELRKVLLGNPRLLIQSIETGLAPKLKWLRIRLHLSESELSKLVLASPPVLTLSIETNLAPKLDWFEQELGLSVSDVRAKILATPSRLTLSLTNRYQPRLEVCRAAGADPVLVLNSASTKDEVFCKRVGVPLETLRAAQENVS